MRLSILLLLPLVFYGQSQAPVIAQFRPDISLTSHGVVVASSNSATFKQDLLSLVGQANFDALGSAVPNCLIITNGSNQPITHVSVRYMKRRGDTAIPSDISFENTTLAQATPPDGKILVLPNDILNDLSQKNAVANAVENAGKSNKLFDPRLFSSAYSFIDSVEFANGAVIGPDTLGYLADQKAKGQVLQLIRDKAYDPLVSDADFQLFLKGGAEHKNWFLSQGSGLSFQMTIDHKEMWTQRWSTMMLTALEKQGREYVRMMSDRLLSYQNRVVRFKEN